MSARYIVAPGCMVSLGGDRFARAGDVYAPASEADAVRLAHVLVVVEESAPADPEPVEAPRAQRGRKAAPVPAVPPVEDDARAPEAG